MELYFASLFFFFGLCVGSFLNVLIDRLPAGESIWFGRSHCDFCKKSLRWYELIPVLSFLFQQGKCLRCKKKLSVQYPLVELITGLAFAYLFYSGMGNLWGVVLSCVIFSTLIVTFVADLKYQIIPDSMVVIGSAAAGLLAYFYNPYQLPILNYVFSAIGASLFFLIIWLATKGRGMGFGDVKFAIFMGLLLGFPRIVMALYAAFLTGAFVGVILILVGNKKLKSRIAFGPFLIFGTVLTLLFGAWGLAIWKQFLW